ncbi:MAG: hypothetical protein LBH22_00325 [Bacteroidales bacterium]|jgi:hypothetical protein|nr:hypothetical protein [Bacteroidales bacterium]
MKKFLKITVLSLFATPIFAQYLDLHRYDQYALAFTMPSLNGNARFTSMGGAFGALGGNLSALSTNPASIGIYRSGEFSFTPALTLGKTEVTPINTADARMREADRMNFNVGNLGLVSVFDIAKTDGENEWKMLQFGFGVNRLADFWNRSNYSGYVNWTYLDEITSEANRFGNVNQFTTRGLAWDAELLDFDTINREFFNDLNEVFNPLTGKWSRTDEGLTQSQTTETRGGINEWYMTFGGNYGDILYLGATIGLPSVNYRQIRTLTERDQKGQHPDFDFWKLRESLEITGIGINLKLGAIVRPTDFLRLGLAVHTPTRYTLKENITREITVPWRSRPYRESAPTFEYSLRTPTRLIGSVGLVIARQALIGVEYEHLNYGKMRVSGLDPNFDDDNDFIADNYRTGGVIRVGGEYRMDQVSLRLGYNYTMTPYNANSFAASDFSGHSFSAGLGFVTGSTSIDLAYVNTMRKYEMQPYSGMLWNKYNVTGHQFLVTFGWRF